MCGQLFSVRERNCPRGLGVREISKQMKTTKIKTLLLASTPDRLGNAKRKNSLHFPFHSNHSTCLNAFPYAETKCALLQNGSNAVLRENLFSHFPATSINFKTNSFFQSHLQGSYLKSPLSAVPSHGTWFSDVLRSCSVFSECTVCLIISSLKTYHWNKNQSGKHDIEMIIISCDLNAAFLSYNTKCKIESP